MDKAIERAMLSHSFSHFKRESTDVRGNGIYAVIGTAIKGMLVTKVSWFVNERGERAVSSNYIIVSPLTLELLTTGDRVEDPLNNKKFYVMGKQEYRKEQDKVDLGVVYLQ